MSNYRISDKPSEIGPMFCVPGNKKSWFAFSSLISIDVEYNHVAAGPSYWTLILRLSDGRTHTCRFDTEEEVTDSVQEILRSRRAWELHLARNTGIAASQVPDIVEE